MAGSNEVGVMPPMIADKKMEWCDLQPKASFPRVTSKKIEVLRMVQWCHGNLKRSYWQLLIVVS